jgi:iron(III) transport system permease protein
MLGAALMLPLALGWMLRFGQARAKGVVAHWVWSDMRAGLPGLSLALMETLADYGTVQYFGIDTFTTGIFRTWFGLDESAAAAQLAALLMGFVFVLILLERWSRRRVRYHATSQAQQGPRRYRLHGWRAGLAVLACSVPVLTGFLIPAGQLLHWSLTSADEGLDSGFITLTWNSLSLAAGAALVAVLLALILAYGKRLHPDKPIVAAVRLAGMGYAIPGTVIAIGVMLPFAWLDNSLDGWMRHHFDISTGLILSGTLTALVFAYTVRFLSVSLQTVEAGLGKIKPSLDDAGRSLGLRPAAVLTRIHLPLMKGTVLTALLLVFVDVLKELPATLILRPFNFETLATTVYNAASLEQLDEAGPAALAIVIVGLAPVAILARTLNRSRPGDGSEMP